MTPFPYFVVKASSATPPPFPACVCLFCPGCRFALIGGRCFSSLGLRGRAFLLLFVHVRQVRPGRLGAFPSAGQAFYTFSPLSFVAFASDIFSSCSSGARLHSILARAPFSEIVFSALLLADGRSLFPLLPVRGDFP